MPNLITNHPWSVPVTIIVILWSIPWKGVALWRAAKRDDQWWFITLLVVNTIGILEILYIFIWNKRPKQPTAQSN